MFHTLQILAIILVAVAMALALAHALELPGKLRLSKDTYLAIQPIYYPGFTIGGLSEPLGLVVLFLLMIATSITTVAFWLTLGAFLTLAAMHAVYWLAVHPVNNFWLKDFRLQAAGATFFLVDPLRRASDTSNPDWTALRDQWEYAHLLRALLALASLTLLAAAVAA
jgi:hypothetical protein